MRKDARKGYARLAQTAQRQTPTTTHAHIHLKLCKFYYANCCVRRRPPHRPHHHRRPLPLAYRPCSRKLVLHSQSDGAQKRTLHPESECNKQLQDTTAWRGKDTQARIKAFGHYDGKEGAGQMLEDNKACTRFFLAFK